MPNRRPCGRRKRVTLSRIDSTESDKLGAAARGLRVQTSVDLSRPREPDSPTSPSPIHAPEGLAEPPTRPASFDAVPAAA